MPVRRTIILSSINYKLSFHHTPYHPISKLSWTILTSGQHVLTHTTKFSLCSGDCPFDTLCILCAIPYPILHLTWKSLLYLWIQKINCTVLNNTIKLFEATKKLWMTVPGQFRLLLPTLNQWFPITKLHILALYCFMLSCTLHCTDSCCNALYTVHIHAVMQLTLYKFML